jgi:tetratricopeptide (TPR) repeat protein
MSRDSCAILKAVAMIAWRLSMGCVFSDAQAEKDQIIQELAAIVPMPDREIALPDRPQTVQALIQQLADLRLAHPHLVLNAIDYIELARAADFVGDYDQAIALFDQALQLDSENGNSWYYLGLTFSKKQQYYPAIHAYNEALRLNPDLHQVHLSKAHCYAIQQQDDLTLVALKKAIRLGGDGVQAVVDGDSLFESIRSRLHAKLEDESEDPIDDLIDQDE